MTATDPRTSRAVPPGRGRMRYGEFLAIVALAMGLSAMSIDVMLPAFPAIREQFGLTDPSSVSLLVTAYFCGLAAGTLIYGPLSDRYGRKPLLYAGLVLFAAGALAAVFMPTFAGVVVCRALWGMGGAGPRSIVLAMVRDTYEGDLMAKVMSQAMAIFLVVPIMAPGVGALLMVFLPWQSVFLFPFTMSIVLGLWLIRLPDTLPPEKRRSARPSALAEAFVEVVRNKRTAAFTVAVTFLFAIMTAYIGSVQLILDGVYGLGGWFPVVFGATACLYGAATFLGSRIVMKVGLARLLQIAAVYTVVVALGFVAIALATGGKPPLLLFVLPVGLLVAGSVVLVPNANTAAMVPLPHVAGMAAAVIGAIFTAGAALIGSLVDDAFDGTITPLVIGMAGCATIAAAGIAVGTRRWKVGPARSFVSAPPEA